MSGSLNKVMLIGNLGKDPELKATPSGETIARFSLATTENWKDAQGQKQSKTEWHNIVVWGKQAELAEKYLRKGKQVLVEGRIRNREYVDQTGVRKYITEIRCDNFIMLGRLEESGKDARPPMSEPEKSQPPSATSQESLDELEEPLPKTASIPRLSREQIMMEMTEIEKAIKLLDSSIIEYRRDVNNSSKQMYGGANNDFNSSDFELEIMEKRREIMGRRYWYLKSLP